MHIAMRNSKYTKENVLSRCISTKQPCNFDIFQYNNRLLVSACGKRPSFVAFGVKHVVPVQKHISLTGINFYNPCVDKQLHPL